MGHLSRSEAPCDIDADERKQQQQVKLEIDSLCQKRKACTDEQMNYDMTLIGWSWSFTAHCLSAAPAHDRLTQLKITLAFSPFKLNCVTDQNRENNDCFQNVFPEPVSLIVTLCIKLRIKINDNKLLSITSSLIQSSHYQIHIFFCLHRAHEREHHHWAFEQ